MKILVFCAKGFETMEFSVFIDVMGWAENDYHYSVSVDTCGFSKTVNSAFHVPVIVDKTIDEIKVNEYDALAIPSVCVAALPLGKSGVLKGRMATTYHLNGAYRQKQLAEFGVHVVNERIVVDDNIITSYCPETAPDVAFELLKKLCGNEKMLVVKRAMGYGECK